MAESSLPHVRLHASFLSAAHLRSRSAAGVRHCVGVAKFFVRSRRTHLASFSRTIARLWPCQRVCDALSSLSLLRARSCTSCSQLGPLARHWLGQVATALIELLHLELLSRRTNLPIPGLRNDLRLSGVQCPGRSSKHQREVLHDQH